MSTEKITEKDDDDIVAVETPPDQGDERDERLSAGSEGEDGQEEGGS